MTDEVTTIVETETEEKADFSKIMGRANIKFALGADVFDAYADIVPDVCGGTKEEFLAAFADFRLAAERDISLKTIEKDVIAYKVPKSLITKLAKGQDHIAQFTITEVKDSDGKITTPGFAPKLMYVLEFIAEVEEVKNAKGEITTEAKAANAILKVISGKVTTRTTGKGDKKGRISAFIAWKNTGKKQGDTFVIVPTKGSDGKVDGYKVDGRFVAFRKLTSFLLAVYPDSHTIAHMKSYPDMKIGE